MIVKNKFPILIFQVEFDMFVKDASAREVGTSRASMNRTMKTNAAKGVQNNYNEYKEFHQREVEGHVCAAFMELNGMTSMDGNDNIFSRDPVHTDLSNLHFSYSLSN